MPYRYVVSIGLPAAVSTALGRLITMCRLRPGYLSEPHVTLLNPFVPLAQASVIRERLAKVAERTKPFSFVISGIAFFEGGGAYAVVENKQPVASLHADIASSLRGFINQDHVDALRDEMFEPHVTIFQQIPDTTLPTVKKVFAQNAFRYEIPVSSFILTGYSGPANFEADFTFNLSG